MAPSALQNVRVRLGVCIGFRHLSFLGLLFMAVISIESVFGSLKSLIALLATISDFNED